MARMGGGKALTQFVKRYVPCNLGTLLHCCLVECSYLQSDRVSTTSGAALLITATQSVGCKNPAGQLPA